MAQTAAEVLHIDAKSYCGLDRGTGVPMPMELAAGIGEARQSQCRGAILQQL